VLKKKGQGVGKTEKIVLKRLLPIICEVEKFLHE
jgi:hypothetical protein